MSVTTYVVLPDVATANVVGSFWSIRLNAWLHSTFYDENNQPVTPTPPPDFANVLLSATLGECSREEIIQHGQDAVAMLHQRKQQLGQLQALLVGMGGETFTVEAADIA